MHNRKFSIPFPLLDENETVDEYLSYIAKYKNYIDDIFLGVPFLGNNYHILMQDTSLLMLEAGL